MKKEVSPWRSGERKFSPGIRVPVLSVRDPRLLIAVTELSAYFPAGGDLRGEVEKQPRRSGDRRRNGSVLLLYGP